MIIKVSVSDLSQILEHLFIFTETSKGIYFLQPKKYFDNKISICVFVLLLVLVVFISLTDANVRVSLIKEGGLIETASAIGYFVCLLFFLLFCRHVKGFWSFAYLLLCMGGNELGLPNFTKNSITGIRFWLNAEISISLKLISAGILSLIIISAIDVVKKYHHCFVSNLKRKEIISVNVFFALIAVLLSQTIDNLFKEIEKLSIGQYFTDLVWVLEECIELGIPIFLFIAILAIISDTFNKAGNSEA